MGNILMAQKHQSKHDANEFAQFDVLGFYRKCEKISIT